MCKRYIERPTKNSRSMNETVSHALGSTESLEENHEATTLSSNRHLPISEIAQFKKSNIDISTDRSFPKAPPKTLTPSLQQRREFKREFFSTYQSY